MYAGMLLPPSRPTTSPSMQGFYLYPSTPRRTQKARAPKDPGPPPYSQLRRTPLLGSRVNKLVALPQPSGLHLVDKAAHGVLVRNERAMLDTRNRLAHILLKVGEGLHGEVRLHAHLFMDLRPQLFVGEGQHPAVGVVDEDDLARA